MRYKWEAYRGTNWRCTAAFPSKAQRYKWGEGTAVQIGGALPVLFRQILTCFHASFFLFAAFAGHPSSSPFSPFSPPLEKCSVL